QKAPHHRFQRAADAAAALLSLEAVEGSWSTPPIPLEIETSADATLSSSATSHEHLERTERTERTLRTVQTVGPWVDEPLRGRVVSRRAPPLPGRPRVLPRAPSLALVGAGLGLFGLRAVPLVGREKEAQLVWQELRTVRETGQARAVVLRG